MEKFITFVGLDVHKNSISVALDDAGRNADNSDKVVRYSNSSGTGWLPITDESGHWKEHINIVKVSFNILIVSQKYIEPSTKNCRLAY